MKNEEIIFTSEEILEFREWIALNMEEITWQGRYQNEFEEFWSCFFLDGQSLSQVIDRFQYACANSQIGPLNQWFQWLKNKLICYTFIFKKADLFLISKKSGILVPEIAVILRNFFVERFPHLDDALSEKFQVVNISSPNLFINFKALSDELNIFPDFKGTDDEDVMTSLEITLYPEFLTLVEKMKRDLYHPNFDFSKIKSSMSFRKQLRVAQELFILTFVAIIAIYGIKWVNKKWEKSLVEKISIYEPQFKWLNKNLVFKSDNEKSQENINLNVQDLEDVEKIENKLKIEEEEEGVRYETESEVSLTSWDSLPKDFDVADREQSQYEEVRGGYRDSRYGNTKVYRVMMKSQNLYSSKDKLNDLLKKYNVTQVDNVKPGQEVPGGVYYNIYVPRVYLKEFMAQIMESSDSVLYESRTRARRNPPGKNKVFIWVKNI
ncbi:hypothetical protein OAT67_02145 [Bacteriovoracaceae bacterium]|nr:hypothetical protein [Bacteriovoracaceae bacterium]|tara:strand:+ start:5953 stop:7260 length:1308 start_codon:yes stop_codon:yes gene_type:complete